MWTLNFSIFNLSDFKINGHSWDSLTVKTPFADKGGEVSITSHVQNIICHFFAILKSVYE